MAETYDAYTRERVAIAFHALKQHLDAEESIPDLVGAALALFVERLALRYGPTIWAEIGRSQIENKQIALGWCPHHMWDSSGAWNRNPPRVDPENGVMCAECWRTESEMNRGGNENTN